MALTAYRYYRIRMINSLPGSGYWTVNTIQLFSDAAGTGTNLATGGGVTATASSSYSGRPASNAIDGNNSTAWSSANGDPNAWLQIDLGSPAVVRSLRLWSDTAGGYVAVKGFELLASSDGDVFTTLVQFPTHNPTGVVVTNALFLFDIHVAGTSVLDDALPASRVLVYDWTSGALITAPVVSPSGAWEVRFGSPFEVLVVHLGPSGYRPLADGPITPVAG
jgi:hypothetical protein